MMMNKRIKITESQFDRLFTEETDPALAFSNLEEGDLIYVKDASGTHSFQVIDDLGNALKLASMDVKSTKTGWHYIVSKNEGVTDGDVKMIQVSKKNPEVKRPYTVKGVEVLKITNKTGVEKDLIDLRAPDTTPTNTVNRANQPVDTEDDKMESLKDTLNTLSGLEPEAYYIFEMDESTNIIFKVLTNLNQQLKVELVSSTGAEASKYNKFKGDKFTIPLDIKNLSVSNMGSGWFNMGVVDSTGNRNMLSNINDFVKYDGEETNAPEDTEMIDKPDQTKQDLEAVLNKYPQLKKAISHQPKLFGLFDMGNPVGLAHVKGLTDKYMAKEASATFVENKYVTFEILNHDITLNVGGKLYRLTTGDKKRLICVKKGNKTILTTSKTARTKYEIEILSRVEDNTYNGKFIGTSVTADGSVREAKKNGVIKVLDYNS